MIPFNKPSITDIERKNIELSLSNKLCGDGAFTKKAYELFKEKLYVDNILLTTSGTSALEMSALLCDFKSGDEVIFPSYTFVSTLNAFLLRGVKPIFCEIEPSTMNIDVTKIEELITPRTKAIVPVHYAGVCCDMDIISNIARKYSLYVIEDAAQAVGSTYKNKPAGTISDFGCFSFHETKNYVMGEGGAIIVNSGDEIFKKAEILREKGTDRSLFLRGEVDKYTWQSIGSSFLPSDVLAAILCGQLQRFDEIMNKRMAIWNKYYDGLSGLEDEGYLRRQYIPQDVSHNAHMFYFIARTNFERDLIISKLKEKEIQAVFHYIPLHSSPVGEKLGYKKEDLPITEEYAGRLIRLPLWTDMELDDVDNVVKTVIDICKMNL